MKRDGLKKYKDTPMNRLEHLTLFVTEIQNTMK